MLIKAIALLSEDWDTFHIIAKIKEKTIADSCCSLVDINGNRMQTVIADYNPKSIP